MYEHLVKNVSGVKPAGGVLVLTYDLLDAPATRLVQPRESTFDAWEIGALETWLKQPKPPTPEERAEEVIGRFTFNNDFGPTNAQDVIAAVARVIAEAEEAARNGA